MRMLMSGRSIGLIEQIEYRRRLIEIDTGAQPPARIRGEGGPRAVTLLLPSCKHFTKSLLNDCRQRFLFLGGDTPGFAEEFILQTDSGSHSNEDTREASICQPEWRSG